MKELHMLIFTLIIPFFGFSQNTGWTNYVNGNSIRAIAFEDNFVWIGTYGAGLVRIDTITGNIKFYNKTNSQIPHPHISSITIDNYGVKWLGLWGGGIHTGIKGGIAKFDGTSWVHYDTSNSGIYSNRISSIYIDQNDNAWIGHNSGGISKFDGINWTIFNEFNSPIPNNSWVYDVTGDTLGNIYIASQTGIYKFDGINWINYNDTNSGLPFNGVGFVEFDNNGLLWIGTNGLATFDGNNWNVYTQSNSGLPDNYVGSISFDSFNNAWIGTFGGGIARFDGTSWQVYNSSNSTMEDNYIRTLNVDKNDNVWVASYGLDKFDGTTWLDINTSFSDIPFHYIPSLLIDKHDNKWIFQVNVLAKFDNTTWTTYNNPYNISPGNDNQAFEIDSSDNIWMGTGKGLFKFDGTNWQKFITTNSGLPHDVVYALKSDSNSLLWIGTGLGLVKYDGTNWQVYNSSNSGLPYDAVREIEIDKNGILWIGTSVGGITKFDGNSTWITFNTSNSGLPSNNIKRIAFDGTGNTWIGTNGSGLAKFDGITWTVYNTTNSGLPVNVIRSLAVDHNDNIWIGSANNYAGGLVKFDGTNWTVYDTYNSGLTENYIRDIAIDSNNYIWLATYGGGLCLFDGCDNRPSIAGTIINNGIPVKAGIVKLKKYNTNPTQMTDVNTASIDTSGNYTFPNLAYGQFLVIAEADTTLYPNTIPTYYDSTNHWQRATILDISTCDSLITANINLIEFPATIGFGKISGSITHGGPVIITNKSGIPIPDVDIFIEQTTDSMVIAHTLTDNLGYYSFTNIPEGQYKIYVDITGLRMDTTYGVNITVNDTAFTDLNFYVDSVSIGIDLSTFIDEPYIAGKNLVEIYPNPNKGTFVFKIQKNQNISITIYNLLGEVVQALPLQIHNANRYEVDMAKLPEGIYFLRVHAGNSWITKKIVRIK